MRKHHPMSLCELEEDPCGYLHWYLCAVLRFIVWFGIYPGVVCWVVTNSVLSFGCDVQKPAMEAVMCCLKVPVHREFFASTTDLCCSSCLLVASESPACYTQALGSEQCCPKLIFWPSPAAAAKPWLSYHILAQSWAVTLSSLKPAPCYVWENGVLIFRKLHSSLSWTCFDGREERICGEQAYEWESCICWSLLPLSFPMEPEGTGFSFTSPPCPELLLYHILLSSSSLAANLGATL